MTAQNNNEVPNAVQVPYDLASLAAAYGADEVSLEEFARLAGLRSGSVLRMRRDRDPDFPAPIRSGQSRPDYTLGALVGWLRGVVDRSDGPGRGPALSIGSADPIEPPDGTETAPGRAPRQWVMQEWALGAAARRCVAAVGADTAFGLIGAVALRLAAGWAPDLGPTAPALVDQVRGPLPAVAEPWAASLLPPGFVPDPPPAADRRVMAQLLDGPDRRPDPSAVRASADPDPLEGLAREVVRAWIHRPTAPAPAPDAFVELVEQTVARLASRSEKQRPVTGAVATDLLVALADLAPGQTLLDPAVGEANVLLRADAVTRRVGVDAQVLALAGRDIDPRAWMVAKVRLGLRGIAHQLGDPGCDSTERTQLDGAYDRIVAEPAGGIRSQRAWLTRLPHLLAPDGIAVVAVPPERLLASAGVGRYWREDIQPHVAVAVLAPTLHGRQAIGAFVLRRDWNGPLMLLQIEAVGAHTLAPGEHAADLLLTRFAVAGELVRRHLRGVAVGDGVTDGVAHRPLADLTVDALTPLRWEDSKVLRSAVAEEPSAQDRLDRIRQDALALTRRLRHYIDATADPDRAAPELDESTRAIFEDETTDEMRRALKRLEQRLGKDETRGRPRSRD